MNEMKKVVFSGGTYCGKTTLVNSFRDLGYPVVPEAGILFMTELKDAMGMEAYKEWRFNNQQEFFEQLVEKQAYLESVEHKDVEFVFYDRSFADTIAMCEYLGIQAPRKAVEKFNEKAYDFIFVCDMLPDFDERQETARVFNQQDSERINQLVREVYLNTGYHPVILGPVSLAERIEIVKATIGL